MRSGETKDKTCNMNSDRTLEKYGLNFSDIWDAQIRGLRGESSPCYTFTSPKKLDVGLRNQVRLVNVFDTKL